MDTKKTMEEQLRDNWGDERHRRVKAEKLLADMIKERCITDPAMVDRIVARLGYEPVR